MDPAASQPALCSTCQLWLADSAQLGAHLQGKKHRRHARGRATPGAAGAWQEYEAREAARSALWN
eukprot:6955261-Lingulodinium_polyedra.AAC.1